MRKAVAEAVKPRLQTQISAAACANIDLPRVGAAAAQLLSLS